MISIRLATLADTPTIHTIAKKTWPIAYENVISPEQIDYMLGLMYSKEKIETAISDVNQAFWLAEIDKEVVGFCGIEHGFPQAGTTRIHKLYVLPSTQGSGIGKILLEHISKEAFKQGNNLLHLNVNKRNNAVKFYEKLGFEIDHEEVLDIGNGYVMDDFIMIKELH